MINTNKTDRFFSIFLIIMLLTHIINKNAYATETEVYSNNPQPTIDLTLPVVDIAPKGKHKKKSTEDKAPEVKPKKVVTYKEMPYEELERVKNKLIATGNADVAIKYLEQMIKICTDVRIIGELLLETGDLFFNNGLFKKAALVYSEFTTLYPGHEKIEFALYRGVISSFNCCLSSDRDQTKTEETIVLANTFLSAAHFTEHREEVLTIRSQCYDKLIESELNICQFYLKRGNLKAANKRLTSIREKWLAIVPSSLVAVLDVEIKIAEQEGDTQKVALKTAEQIEYKTSLGITVAQTSTITRMIDRF